MPGQSPFISQVWWASPTRAIPVAELPSSAPTGYRFPREVIAVAVSVPRVGRPCAVRQPVDEIALGDLVGWRAEITRQLPDLHVPQAQCGRRPATRTQPRDPPIGRPGP